MLVPLAAFDRHAIASAMAPGITTTRWRICASLKAITASPCFRGAGNRRRAALHTTWQDYVLTETEMFDSGVDSLRILSSVTWSQAGRTAISTLCPAWSATGRSIAWSSMAKTLRRFWHHRGDLPELLDAGADGVARSGNHAWDQREAWCSSNARRAGSPANFQRAPRPRLERLIDTKNGK